MAITLQQPLGSDIYSIAVFNSNAQLIEENINNMLSSIENIENILPTKYNIINLTSSDTIDIILNNNVYYILDTVNGTYPNNTTKENSIVFVIGDEISINIQTLVTNNGKIYQRSITNTTVINDWQSLTNTVVDDLITQDVNQALSANQGYILNNSKLDIKYVNSTSTPNSIDIDSISSGIYVCDGIEITGTLPDFMPISTGESAINNKIVIESEGKIGETTTKQIITNGSLLGQAIRTGSIVSDAWTWSDWKPIAVGDGSGSGGGGNNNIQLEIVEL